MNKTALKNFATNARRELLERVELQALKIGITTESIQKATIESSDAIFISGKQLSKEERKQRNKLIARIYEIGFNSVMEEVAYTWFNRFTALRFMEVNNYLPTKVRVLSSTYVDSAEPDMMKEALSLDLDLDKEYLYELKLNNNTEELFKYLIIKHCNDLNRYMPFMFETIDDYTEILFPGGLIATDSFVRQLTNLEIITEKDWEQIEIIGWLYQYYNTEMNELVYDGNMSKSRIPKELLPAATQLFTPDWAVKYMVENSLGRLWLEGNSNYELKESWKYYLEDIELESSVNDQFDPRAAKYKHLNPEDIKIFDPCMGSGHILVYSFEILMQIYESRGYLQQDAAKLILQKNLYGLEIDYRAYQLACFALVMKARKYNKRILSECIELNLCSIVESDSMNNFNLIDIKNQLKDNDIETLNYVIAVFKDAKEYGSILNVEMMDYDSLQKSLINISNYKIGDLFQNQLIEDINEIIPKLLKQARLMSKKYDVVITNPPYLGNSRMSPLLNEYVKNYYPDTKSDLSTVMYQKAISSYSKPSGFISYITTTSWMFLKSFEKFREKVLKNLEFTSLVDFGTELFDGKVGHNPIVSWVNRNAMPQKNMIAIRLVDYCYSRRNEKELEYFNINNRYYPKQENFKKISGSPIAYWVEKNLINIFENNPKLENISRARSGLKTGKNELFLKYWWEIEYKNFSSSTNNYEESILNGFKWFPHNKGGNARNWYGNNELVVNFSGGGATIKKYGDENNRSYDVNAKDVFFNEGITWTALTSSKNSFRYSPVGSLFDSNKGPMIFDNGDNILWYLLGFFNSNVAQFIMKVLNPTLSLQNGDMNKIPVIISTNNKPTIDLLSKENVFMSKEEWDSFEISWDFKSHPLNLIKGNISKIEIAFKHWESFTIDRFNKLKQNEEKLNRIFFEIYGLQDEISAEVVEKDITIRKADLNRDIKSFLSYAIGCSFGRYSLEEDGLIHADGDINTSSSKTFPVDRDNIMPILPGAYFEDDIVSRIINFVQVSFGEESLSENLDFVSGAIGRKRGETAKEALRRYFINDFYNDHVQIYKKKPIYWQFTSGKEKAFNCLIYIHRYDKSTLSRIRTDYLHEYQIRLDAEKKDLLNLIEGLSTAKENSNAKKELKSLDKKIDELKRYDELLHHMADMHIEIDLDDGVAVNYEKFKGLVAKI